jgi:aspartate aminotransferase
MNPLSDRINNLSTSQTLAMAALRELKAQGKISLV